MRQWGGGARCAKRRVRALQKHLGQGLTHPCRETLRMRLDTQEEEKERGRETDVQEAWGQERGPQRVSAGLSMKSVRDGGVWGCPDCWRLNSEAMAGLGGRAGLPPLLPGSERMCAEPSLPCEGQWARGWKDMGQRCG